MPLPPFPVAPQPVTWTPGQVITTAQLDADLANAALLLANRPLFAGQQSANGQSIGTGLTTVGLDTEFLDAWAGHTIPNAPYAAPLAGIYLVEGALEVSSQASTNSIACGIQVAAGSTVIRQDQGGTCNGSGTEPTGVTCADLVALDPSTSENVSLWGQSTAAVGCVTGATAGTLLRAEWVSLLPTGSAPGTIVANPQGAVPWPPGAGTVITSPGGIAAGATTVDVADTTGMVAGGTLGLDYYMSAQAAPVAETVTITSVTPFSSAVGITATAYPHVMGAPVSIPVSAAFLNQQVRDGIRFLCFPPVACLDNTGAPGALVSQTIPAGTQIPFANQVIDTWNGWNGSTGWAAPMEGLYYLYGQVALTSAHGLTLTAGLQVNSGTIMWGAGPTNVSTTSRASCATVRRMVRLQQGDVVSLWANQNSGGAVNLATSTGFVSRLIAVWRRF